MDKKINKITVVKYERYLKQHRGYLTRDNLQNFPNNKKYLYFFNKRKSILAILLKRKNKYYLYNLSHPNQKEIVIYKNTTLHYKRVLKKLRRYGFRLVKSLADKGYVASVNLRKFKKVKTLLIEVKDYTRLQKVYKHAIKTYNSKKIKSIRTKLPKALIYSHYKYYRNRANTDEKRKQIDIISRKLGLKVPPLMKVIEKKPLPIIEDVVVKPKLKIKPVVKPTAKQKQKKVIKKEKKSIHIVKPKPIIRSTQKAEPRKKRNINRKTFTYYLKHAPLKTLSSFLSKSTSKNTLSYKDYKTLLHRKNILKENKLLNEGSLETLISAYKINKSSRYKNRIMLLMKRKQNN